MLIKDRIHHANLLIGSAEGAESYVHEVLKDLNVSEKNNPDFITFRDSTFGIDEARNLSHLSNRHALGEKKVFLIIPERITAEAQNALLKTFEDPSSDTVFFLVVKEDSLIIPTLRSRMNSIRIVKHSVFNTGTEVENFLKLSTKDRLIFVKKFVDDELNLSNFLDELMVYLRQNKKPKELEQVYGLRKFADDRGASSRLVLEHLSLVL